MRGISDVMRSRSRARIYLRGHHDLRVGAKEGKAEAVSVLYLTIFISLMLALFFAAGFLYHHDYSGGDPLRDSLLPFNKQEDKKAPKVEADAEKIQP